MSVVLRTWPWISTFPLNSNNYEALGLYFRKLSKDKTGVSGYKTMRKASLELRARVARRRLLRVRLAGELRAQEGWTRLQRFCLPLTQHVAIPSVGSLCHNNYFKTIVPLRADTARTSAGPLLVPCSIERTQTRRRGGPSSLSDPVTRQRASWGAGPAGRRPEHVTHPRAARCLVPVPGWRMVARQRVAAARLAAGWSWGEPAAPARLQLG